MTFGMCRSFDSDGARAKPALLMAASTSDALASVWHAQAAEWARFVRTPGIDLSNERFNVPRLIELLPAPGRATLDVGCGEGRLGRRLVRLGHRVVGVDSSPDMVALAAESQEAVVADAGALPFDDGAFDLVTAFMSLMDVEDMPGAVREVARVLEAGGRFCFSIAHPTTPPAGSTSGWRTRRFALPTTSRSAAWTRRSSVTASGSGSPLSTGRSRRIRAHSRPRDS